MFPKLLLPILILIPLAVLALVFFPPSSPSSLDPKLTTQNSQPDAAPAVTVSAEYLPDKSTTEIIVFQISLNTHSVGLDNIDFQKSVILEKSGQKFSPLETNVGGSGLPAEASAKAGHHRSAEVKFNRASPPLKIIFLETPEVNQQEFEFDELK